MEIIKKEIYLTDDKIDSLKNLFFSTLTFTTCNPVNISIIIGKNEIISFEITKSSLKNAIKVTINLLNIDYLTGEESRKEIKVFDKVYNIESLNMIGFKYDETFYFFRFNLKGIINININKYIECTDNNYDYIFGLTCFLGSDSQDELDDYGLYACDNILYITPILAELILKKIDYLGFDELFRQDEYFSLKYNKKESTKYLMSFLIYCLKNIKNSAKNYYSEKEISNIAYNIIIPF